MEHKKIVELFDEKTSELLNSSFYNNLDDSGIKIKWKQGKDLKHQRRGPNYEEIKNFVITFRNFTLDSDVISIRNISNLYDSLPSGNDIKYRFEDARIKFNEYLDSSTVVVFNHIKISNRELINTYIYGDVIHLNKNDEFKRWISSNPIKDVVFNEIVIVLSNCLRFISFFNNLNKEYLTKYSNI